MSGELMTIGLFALPVVLVLLMVAQYIALRVRDTRATPQDPHLGRKTACYFFINLSVLLVLIGLTVSSADWMEYLFEPIVQAQQAPRAAPNTSLKLLQPGSATGAPREWFNDNQRSAAGLVTSGLLHGLLFWLIVRFATNDRDFPAVRRAFAGMRFVLTGLVVMTTTTVTTYSLFQKGDTDYETLQVVCSVAVVWGPAAVIHLVMVMWSSGWRRARPEQSFDD